MALGDLLNGGKRSGLRDLLVAPEPLVPLVEDAPLEQGLAQGFYGSSIGNANERKLDAELRGDAAAMAAADQEVQGLQQRSAEYAPRVRSYKDVNDVGDAVNYGLGAFGQGVASMAPIAGAALAARAGIGGKVAPYLGAFAVGHDMAQGEAIGQQYADPEIAALDAQTRDSAANTQGFVQGAAESLVPGMLGARFLRPGGALRTIGQASGMEAATEGVQTRLGQASLEGLRNDTNFAEEFAGPVSGQQQTELIDAAIMGALSGGGMAAPVAATQGLANAGAFGLDQVKKVPGLFQSDPDAPKGDAPIDLSKLDIREHLKKVMEPAEGSARASAPRFSPDEPPRSGPRTVESDLADMEALPVKAVSVAEAVALADDKWVNEDLRNEAVEVGRGAVTDPMQLNAFMQKVKAQDTKNELAALAEDAVSGGKGLGKKVGDAIKPHLENALAKGKDLLSGKKANLQNPDIRAREDIAVILFDHLKPEALQDPRVIKTLPDISEKLSVLGWINENASKEGLKAAQFAQRTGRLNAEDLASLDKVFPALNAMVKDPKAFTNAIKQYGNFDADTKGLPRESFAAKDAAKPSSTFSSLLTDDARSAGPQYVTALARAVDSQAIAAQPNKEVMGHLARAFGGEQQAQFLVSMYRNQVSPQKASGTGKTLDADPQQDMTEKAVVDNVRYEMGGVDGKTAFRLDMKQTNAAGRQVNALQREVAEERRNDGTGGLIARPKRAVVKLEDIAKELHPEDVKAQDKYLRKHARKIISDIKKKKDSKGASPELAVQRERDKKMLEDLGFEGRGLTNQMDKVRTLLANYGAKRVETPDDGSGPGATFRSLRAMGRRGAVQEKKWHNHPDPRKAARAAKLRETMFSYKRTELGKTKKVELSADSLVRGYRARGRQTAHDATAEQVFQEVIADLMISDPNAIKDSLTFPEGFKVTTEGEAFDFETARTLTPEQRKTLADRVAAGEKPNYANVFTDGLTGKQRKGRAQSQSSTEITRAREFLSDQVGKAEDRIESLYEDGTREDLEALNDTIGRLFEARGRLQKALFYMNPMNEAEHLARKASEPKDKPSGVMKLVEWMKGGAGRTAALRDVSNEYRLEAERLVDERMSVMRETVQEMGAELERADPTANEARIFDEPGVQSAVLHPRKDSLQEERTTKPRRSEAAENFYATTGKRILAQLEVASALVDFDNQRRDDMEAYLPTVSKPARKLMDQALKRYFASVGPAKAAYMRGMKQMLDTPVLKLFEKANGAQNEARFARGKADKAALERFGGNPFTRLRDPDSKVPDIARGPDRGVPLKSEAKGPIQVPYAPAARGVATQASQDRAQREAAKDLEPDPTKGRPAPQQGDLSVPVPPAAKYKARVEEQRARAKVTSTVRPIGFGKKANQQTPGTAVPPAVVAVIKAELGRILGADADVGAVAGKKDPVTGEIDTGLEGNALGTYSEARREIRVSLMAGDPLSVGYHEALHDFFTGMSKTPAGKRVREALMRAAEQPHVREQLAKLLAKHPAALGQIESDPEERVAYLFQFWAAGKFSGTPIIKLPPAATNAFAKLLKYFQELFGVISADARIAKVFDALYEGRFADRSTVGAVLSDMKLDTIKDKYERVAGPVAELFDKLLMAAPDRLRKLGTAAMDELANAFAKEPGREGGKLAFLQRRSQSTAQRINAIAKMFKETTAEQRTIALQNMQSMKDPSSPLEHEIAAMLKELRQYMVDKGVLRYDAKTKSWGPLPDLPNYFPRKWDGSKISQNEAEFRALLAQHGQVTADAQDEIIRNIQRGDGHIETADDELHVGFTPWVAAVEKRKFDFIDASNAAAFVKFQNDDLADILTTYTYQAVHRAEFADQFDNDGGVIKDYMERASKDLSVKELAEAQETVKAMVGTLGSSMNPRAKQLMSGLITAENVILLPLTIFSQFTDALGVGLRSNSSTEAWNAFTRGMKDIGRALARQGNDADTDMAETLGLIDEQNMLEAMGQAHAGAFMSKFARDVNRKFFKWNGMETWNRSMRVSAMVAGERFMLREKGNGRYMRELGLDASDVLPTGDGRMAVTPQQILLANPKLNVVQAEAQSAKVQAAIFRFVDGAVLRPNSAHRPVWGSDPHFMLLFHLKQFTFSFQKTILARTGNEFDHGKFLPVAIMLAYVPITFASLAARGMLTGVPVADGTFWGSLSYAVQRSGIMGVNLGFGGESVGDLARGNLPGTSALGPAAQHAWMAGRYVAGDDATTGAQIVDRSLPFAKYFNAAPAP